jgi:hypothetical protein
MKQYILPIICSMVLAGCSFRLPGATVAPTPTPTPTPTPFVGSQQVTPTETPEQAKANLGEAVSQLFIEKYGWDAGSFTVAVNKIEGSYSSGSVKQNQEQSGGMWFAAKDKGGVYLVYDGNGVIDCALLNDFPNFPNTMIPECYNVKAGKTVKR